MYANPNDPESISYPHEAMSFDANSVGLFQQRAEWWGTCAQRMDPYQSALMFFNRLKGFDYNDQSHTPGYWAQQVQGSAFPDRYDEHVGEAQALYDQLTLGASKTIMEKKLNYDRGAVGDYDGVAQTRSWDCGPASAQILLDACGIARTEQWLIDQIGTTVDGTNSAEYIVPVLNRLLPGSGYKAVWLPNDPPNRDQVETLWKNVVRSIDAGRGVILNFEAPPNNFPRATRGDTSPEYRGGNTIFHYTAGMGYADDGPGGRHIWVADPGFRPFGYWCSLEQVASLIVPHAYAYAADAKPVTGSPIPAPAPPVVVPAPKPAPTPAPTLDKLSQLWLEWNAVEYGDPASISQVVQSAQAGDTRAVATLAVLERANPAALQAFITSKGK
jgi:hypothetical protein